MSMRDPQGRHIDGSRMMDFIATCLRANLGRDMETVEIRHALAEVGIRCDADRMSRLLVRAERRGLVGRVPAETGHLRFLWRAKPKKRLMICQ